MTPAVAQAEAAGIEFTLHEFASRPGAGYGVQVVSALGLPVERVFKTLIARLDGSELVVAVVPVAGELHLKRLAAAAGARWASLAPPREAERATGYLLGGISPLGQRQRLPTFLDRSAFDHATVYVSGGRRGLELELGPAALRDVCDARVADLSRGTSGVR